MIVCVCKAINDRAIRRAVAEGHDTLDALQLELGVGTCCGKCVASACEVLSEARVETMDVEASRLHRTTHPVHVQRASSREFALA